MEKVYKVGQRVLVTRTRTFTFELDIKDYLDDVDETEISDEELKESIMDNFDVSYILDEWDIVDNEDDLDEITKIVLK